MRDENRAKRFIESLCEIKDRLNEKIVGRDRETEFLLACVAAEVPILLLGDPGTGKSYLVKEFANLINAKDTDYFHYLLTQFTEPSEIFGPLDMNKLMGEDGGKKIQPIHTRIIDGKMPEATIVFLDEVFKANSAILNTLLTLTNEKKFYNNGKWSNVPLRILITASNEMPQTDELRAFVDRIPIRIHSKYLSFDSNKNSDNLRVLLGIQMKNEINRKNNESESIDYIIELTELSKGIDALIYEFEKHLKEILDNFELRSRLESKIEIIRNAHNSGLFKCNISDRKIISILKVAIARKMIQSRSIKCEVTYEDIKEVLYQTWDELESENDLIARINSEE